MMPAYSRFVADYGTPFVERQWRPEPFRASMGLKIGTISLGIGSLVNLGQEFLAGCKERNCGSDSITSLKRPVLEEHQEAVKKAHEPKHRNTESAEPHDLLSA